jgi:hypothetical protein
MVGMRMGDNGLVNGLPRIDVHVGLLTKDSRRC